MKIIVVVHDIYLLSFIFYCCCMIYIFVVAPAPSVQRRTLPPAVDTLRVQRYADSGSRFIILACTPARKDGS